MSLGSSGSCTRWGKVGEMSHDQSDLVVARNDLLKYLEDRDLGSPALVILIENLIKAVVRERLER